MNYGIDWDGPVVVDESDADQVIIPECNCPLSDAEYMSFCYKR